MCDRMFGILLMLSAAGYQAHAELPAEELNRLMIPPFRGESIQASYGLRSLKATGPDKLELEIGCSCANGFDRRESYRIVSFGDSFYSMYAMRIPEKVEAERIEEAPGWFRTRVKIKLPRAMIAGNFYSVSAAPYNGIAMTYARDGVSCRYPEGPAKRRPEGAADETFNLRALGLRGAVPAGEGVIQLSFGPAATEKTADIAQYEIRRDRREVRGEMVFSRKAVDAWKPSPTGGLIPIYRTDVFLKLPGKLQDGEIISIKVPEAVSPAWDRAELRFDTQSSVSPSYTVNRYGYVRNDPVKAAYLNVWGEIRKEPEFTVYRIGDGMKVMSGKVEPPGDGTRGRNRERKYRIELGSLQQAGRYCITVPGTGRSLPFRIQTWEDSNIQQLAGIRAENPDRMAGKPWWTNVWSYNPYHPVKLTSWTGLGIQPPPDGLESGRAPVQIGGKPWWSNVWSYNPYAPGRSMTAWKTLRTLNVNTYPEPEYQELYPGEKPWWTNIWEKDPD